MGSIAEGLANVLGIVFNMVQLLVLASVIVSWVGADPSNQIVQMIHRATEPIYRPIRKFTSKIPGPLDWSPIVVILIIVFLQSAVVKALLNYARTSY